MSFGLANKAVSLFRKPDNSGVIAYRVLNHHRPGVPLVLVSGLSASGLLDWHPLSDEIAQSRPVLLFDNRGIGLSTIPQNMTTWTMQDMASDVIDLVKHLNWGKIDILGYSMGGMITSTVLTQGSLPFEVRHVILAATAIKRGPSKLGSAHPGDISHLPADERFKKQKEYQKIFYDEEFLKVPENDRIVEQRVRQGLEGSRPINVTKVQMSAIMGYDLRKGSQRYSPKTKVLVIHGEQDVAVLFGETKYTKAFIPHARIFAYKNMGHQWLDYFTVSYWSALISSFLDDQPIDSYRPEIIEKRPKL